MWKGVVDGVDVQGNLEVLEQFVEQEEVVVVVGRGEMEVIHLHHQD
jgi:hypothetical protein